MNHFADALKQIDGLDYVAEQLNFSSVLGRPFLNNRPWITHAETLRELYDRLDRFIALYHADIRNIRMLQGYLHAIRAIQGTVNRLKLGEILFETELFEIKYFAFHVEQIRKILMSYSWIELVALNSVYQLLDPDSTFTTSFMIYDSYSKDLAVYRRKLKEQQSQSTISDYEDQWFIRVEQAEQNVRKELSRVLQPYNELLLRSLNEMAMLDFYLALAEFTVNNHLIRPELIDHQVLRLSYEGLINLPEFKRLQERNVVYQPIDVELHQGVSVLTGINMGGKTMLLKSVALSQAMAQFGFFVPAHRAQITLVDQLFTAYETHSHEPGLSSFAYEMIRLNKIIDALTPDKRMLLFMDEPARTTNPDEGAALVNAIIHFMNKQTSITFLTTHFSGIVAPAIYYQVKGIDLNVLPMPITPGLLRNHMDYSLIEYDHCHVPHEALTVAQLLGVSASLIASAKQFMVNNEITEKI